MIEDPQLLVICGVLVQVIRCHLTGIFCKEPSPVKYALVIASKAADPDRRTNSSLSNHFNLPSRWR